LVVLIGYFVSDTPKLSVIIPCYNEEKRLHPTLVRVTEWLDEQGIDAEILAVDDGSKDATVELIKEAANEDRRIQCLENGANRGKGYSVGHGVTHAKGEQILFSDADLSTPIEEYLKLRKALESADIAIGSRAMAESRLEKRQPIYREMMGRTFNLMVKTLVFPGISDTQCGFKLFRHDAAMEVFKRRKIDGFAFDVELLFIAKQLGMRVTEIPVTWVNDEASRVNPILHSTQMFVDIMRVRRLHRDL
jgi:dolichyl-phosphate beta-glucosyltransferase